MEKLKEELLKQLLEYAKPEITTDGLKLAASYNIYDMDSLDQSMGITKETINIQLFKNDNLDKYIIDISINLSSINKSEIQKIEYDSGNKYNIIISMLDIEDILFQFIKAIKPKEFIFSNSNSFDHLYRGIIRSQNSK